MCPISIAMLFFRNVISNILIVFSKYLPIIAFLCRYVYGGTQIGYKEFSFLSA